MDIKDEVPDVDARRSFNTSTESEGIELQQVVKSKLNNDHSLFSIESILARSTQRNSSVCLGLPQSRLSSLDEDSLCFSLVNDSLGYSCTLGYACPLGSSMYRSGCRESVHPCMSHPPTVSITCSPVTSLIRNPNPHLDASRYTPPSSSVSASSDLQLLQCERERLRPSTDFFILSLSMDPLSSLSMDPLSSLARIALHRPLPVPAVRSIDEAVCRLETSPLWQHFHQLGTEMIITRTGRYCALSAFNYIYISFMS